MNLAQETAAAYAAFAVGNNAEAAERTQRILREFPLDPAALTLTGRLALISGEPDVAHDAFQSVLRRHPREAALWVDLGAALRDLNRHAQARDALRRAAMLDEANRAAWIKLGEIHLSLNEREEASQAFRKALELDPRSVGAFRGLMQLEAPDLDSALVGRFERLSESETLKAPELAQLHYTLAQLHRRAGSKEKFIYHLFVANARQRAMHGDAREQYRRMFDRIEAVFTKETFSRLHRAAPVHPVPLFVLGMPRSGTTLVERILAAQPKLSAAGELDYMRRSLRRAVERTTNQPFPEGIAELDEREVNALARAFAHRLQLLAPHAAVVSDKTPGNYHLLGLLRVLFPQGHIIHVRRDPMDTCFSILQYPFDDRSPHTCDISLLAYSYARYVRLMNKWQELFGDEFVTVQYEELVANPREQAQRMYRHCGFEWRDEYLAKGDNRSAVRTFSALQVREPIHRRGVGAWLEFAEALEPLRAALQEELKTNL